MDDKKIDAIEAATKYTISIEKHPLYYKKDTG